MTTDKQTLETTLAAIREKWGSRAIGRLGRQSRATIPIPTGFSALDQALATGGIPRGRITEIIGAPTSGMATLALKTIAQAQTDLEAAVIYLDLGRTFDPDYAARCGVQLERLFLVRPERREQAFALTRDFVHNGGLSLLLFDVPLYRLTQQYLTRTLSLTLGHIVAPLSKSGCALVFLTTLPVPASASLDHYPPQVTLPHYATTRLLITKERWLRDHHDVVGYQARVRIVKHKLAAVAGREARIRIDFQGVVRGDGT